MAKYGGAGAKRRAGGRGAVSGGYRKRYERWADRPISRLTLRSGAHMFCNEASVWASFVIVVTYLLFVAAFMNMHSLNARCLWLVSMIFVPLPVKCRLRLWRVNRNCLCISLVIRNRNVLICKILNAGSYGARYCFSASASVVKVSWFSTSGIFTTCSCGPWRQTTSETLLESRYTSVFLGFELYDIKWYSFVTIDMVRDDTLIVT